MRVILTQNVKNLGLEEDIKEVPFGYARNFLIPKGLAQIATPQAVKEVQTQKAVQTKEEEEKRKKALEVAKKLKGLTVAISAKIGEEGKLFGSIASEEIAKALKNQAKIEIDKKVILLDEPIRKVGKYKVKVGLFKDVETILQVKIEEKKE